jgi:hypothetical protein
MIRSFIRAYGLGNIVLAVLVLLGILLAVKVVVVFLWRLL